MEMSILGWKLDVFFGGLDLVTPKRHKFTGIERLLPLK
jgi:hypothetical protein